MGTSPSARRERTSDRLEPTSRERSPRPHSLTSRPSNVEKGAFYGRSHNPGFSTGRSVGRGTQRSPDDLLHSGWWSWRSGPRALAGAKRYSGYAAGGTPGLRQGVSG